MAPIGPPRSGAAKVLQVSAQTSASTHSNPLNPAEAARLGLFRGRNVGRRH